MKITPQSEQYGLPYKEARPVPHISEMDGFFGGHRITEGMYKRADPWKQAGDVIQFPQRKVPPKSPFTPGGEVVPFDKGPMRGPKGMKQTDEYGDPHIFTERGRPGSDWTIHDFHNRGTLGPGWVRTDQGRVFDEHGDEYFQIPDYDWEGKPGKMWED